MNPLNLSSRIRLAVLRTTLRAAGYLLRKAIAPALASAPRPAAASSQTSGPESGRVINGEYRRIDPRHNNNW
jgi:hypothetical protein